MLHNSRPHLDSKSISLNSHMSSHVVDVLPRKTDFTLEMVCMQCTTQFRTDISILVVVFIVGRSPQIVEATEPPNFASVPISLHLL